MLNKLIRLSLDNREIVLASIAVLLLCGAYVAMQLPVDVFPDLTAPTVTVITEAHGMAADEVEYLVTFPIETAVNGATGVRRVRSSSSSGISIVWVEFEWGTNIFTDRQIVNEKLQLAAASLPEGAQNPVLTPISSIMGEIMLISMSIDSTHIGDPETINEMELRSLADWNIRRRLLAIPGVAQVIPIGGDVKQYQILVSSDKMQAYGITLDEVISAARQVNKNSSGGIYADAGSEYLVRGIGRVTVLEDIAASVVAMRGGQPVLFRDVAEIKTGPAVKFGDGSSNATPAVILTVQKQPNANTVALTEEIERVVSDIQKSLPGGIKIDTSIFKQADFINVAVNNVIQALRDGAILIILILFIFLGNLRTTFISVLTIPIALFITIFVFELLDITINTMSLGGMAIAIGALVDDAIIDVENVFRRLKERLRINRMNKNEILDVIYEASKEIRSPMVNATIIIIIVFFPLFFLGGVEGRLLRPMGYSYITSILASLLVALTVTPVLSYYLLRNASFMYREKESVVVRVLKFIYSRSLNLVLRFPGAVIISAFVMLLITLIMLPALGRSFLPEFNEGSLTLSVITLPGTSLDESNGIGTLTEEILLSHPEVKSTARRTGRAELDEHALGVYSAEVDVRFELNGRDKNVFIGELRRSLSIIPGTNITIGQPIGHRIDHMLSGTRANIAIKLFGPDLSKLRLLAGQIRDVIEGTPGLVDLAIENQQDVPQTRITFNRKNMAAYGVQTGNLADAIETGFSGTVVSQIIEGQRGFDLIVRFDEESRGNLNAIKNARFNTPRASAVPLSFLADISNGTGPNIINRENVQRKLVIQANVAERDLRGVIDDVRQRIELNVNLPPGYYVEYGGQFESEQAASRIITLLSIVSVIFIFMILYKQFGNARETLIVMVNLPLALIGGVWTVFATGGILSIASLVGFITLFGIATRNGILMISHYNNLLSENIPLREVIIRGSLERLNPILMTAATAALALLPLALGGGEPGKEIQSPMAIVILGGLISSTALNMIIVPCLFYKLGKKSHRD